MKKIFYDFCNRAIEWIFRLRTLGAQLLKGGVALLIVLFGADYAFKFAFKYEDINVDVQGSSGTGLPAAFVYTAAIIAILMIIIGGLLIWRDERRERRKQLIVVEVRGLHSSPDSPARDAIKRSFRGERHPILVDFRPSQSGELVNPERMLNSIHGMVLNMESAAKGRDMSDVSVAVGGIAAVPGMFFIGMRMEDESVVERYDWDRDLRSWKMIDAFDDGNRPLSLKVPTVLPPHEEVVLAVSASYRTDDAAIANTFPGLPVIRLEASKIEVNSYWSQEVQLHFAKAFRSALQELLDKQVRRIHLILAAPASLTLLLGSTYDERLHPEIIVYQFEKSSTPQYPWGILLPNHGSAKPMVIRTA